jgi:HSP20 family protein
MQTMILLKEDPSRPGWYVSEQAHSFVSRGGQWRLTNRSHVWHPPTDVYEVEEAVIVRVEIAGMQEDDFSIALSDRNLVIRGFRSDVAERRAYHQMEIFFGEFMSEVELPCPVMVDQATAEYRMGFLRLVLPKVRPKIIRIK